MKNIFIGVVVLFILSCKGKSYRYIEIASVEQSNGSYIELVDKEKVLEAETEEKAYLKAFEKYCISLQANKTVEKQTGKVFKKPIEFKLINEDGIDISKVIEFKNKAVATRAIEKAIFKEINIDVLYVENKNSFKENKVNDSLIKVLSVNFKKNKDEFDPNKLTWYEHKNQPKYINQNGNYIYFGLKENYINNSLTKLRWKFQYHGEAWLFIKKLQFVIDGDNFEYLILDSKRDNEGGKIWEWFDVSVDESNRSIILALSNAKKVKVKIIGDKYHEVLSISRKELKAYNETITLYKALGGKI